MMTEVIERVLTDCLYPSFEQVEVMISRIGDIIRVSDDGGAIHSALVHGIDADQATKAVHDAALQFGAMVRDGIIYADALTDDWQRSAVLAVANASARAAYAALSPSPTSEHEGETV